MLVGKDSSWPGAMKIMIDSPGLHHLMWLYLYVISPLFFISVQLSLPEVKPKEESPDSPLTSDTQANRAEEARV